jgi:hypothetical protein
MIAAGDQQGGPEACNDGGGAEAQAVARHRIFIQAPPAVDGPTLPAARQAGQLVRRRERVYRRHRV